MKRLLIISMLLMSLSACEGDDDDCVQNVTGCDSDQYSCPASSRCYSTKGACSSSGDC